RRLRAAHAAPARRPDRARRAARRTARGRTVKAVLRLAPLVGKAIVRSRTRSLLTVAGVAVAMFLFVSVQAMRTGVGAATARTDGDDTLIVYRENRFCPFTSRLPQWYAGRIARL